MTQSHSVSRGPSAADVTLLIRRWSDGDDHARDEVVELLYEELRRLAGRQLSGSSGVHTLQPTVLVHEAFERLNRAGRIEAVDKSHFLFLAARVMRQVLVDYVRKKNAAKRGSGRQVTLQTGMADHDPEVIDLLSLDQAFNRLEEENPDHVRLVELRYFGGLSIEEAARVMGRSVSTVNRNWRAARAWLYLELQGDS